MKKILTLCIVQQGDNVLLGMKKRGFGEGRWNGFGGKVKEGEGIEEAAKRELREEAGIVAEDLEERGLLKFTFQNDPVMLEVHVFHTPHFTGELVETEEMRPQWFEKKRIPFEHMWPDDKFWFPLFLKGKKFKGRFLFQDTDILLEHKLKEL
jgi:8-oxo-dGTP diphosphatase / 2-hydroxy-dATP diphosphatase